MTIRAVLSNLMQHTDKAEAASMFKALGSPIRVSILCRLALEPETCACDFHEVFNLTQPTVSQHLKVLRDSGLVRTRRMGNKICYSINPESIRQLESILGTMYPATRQVSA